MTEQTGMPQPLPTHEDFPAQWEDPSLAQRFWMRERMHFPDQVTMLEADIVYALDVGRNRALIHYGIPQSSAVLRINSYIYDSTAPSMGSEEAAVGEEALQATMQAAVGSLEQMWVDEYLPEIQEHLAYWSDFDLSAAADSSLLAHLEETMQRFERVWDLHFRIVVPMLMPMGLFDEMCAELFPSNDAFAAFRMMEGLPNKTTESGVQLWKLSRRALASDEIGAALAIGDVSAVLASLGQSEDGRAFRNDLDAYLQEYGQRGDKWALGSTSWIEDPTPVLNNLRDYMGQPDRDLVAEMEAVVGRREEAIAEARVSLQGYPEPVVQQFEYFLKKAQECTVLSEDHGFWIDFRCAYRVRMVVMEIGRRFVASGMIEAVDDLFHLTLDEIYAGLSCTETDYRPLVVERKAEMERWSNVGVPDVLGTPPPGKPPDTPLSRTLGKFFGRPVDPSTDASVIRGHVGSPGVVTGRARIIRSISEAAILEPGDVLVAETTAPPWTPLFGTVAAVVTDTGGILSHCAVVAREYGIPAVVGTAIATKSIVDGQMIEVDGNAGEVRLVEG